MRKIKIISFNMKNNDINQSGGIRKDGISNAKVFADKVKEDKIDLIGTQELTVKYIDNIKLQLKDYKCYGNYRFGDGIFVNVPFNENNNIITNKKVIYQKTIYLPWIPAFKDLKESIQKRAMMPRIATIVVIEKKGMKTCMINTHLGHRVESVRNRQLKVLLKLVKKYSKKYPVVLTGDFNMDVNDAKFIKLVKKLESINMQRVLINEITWRGRGSKGKTIDHIFIPDNWKIERSGVIDDPEINKISDHSPIFVEARIR